MDPSPASTPPPVLSPGSPDAELLADRLTEEVAQLLYVVRQDLCELGGPDPELAAGARCRTSQAIAALFEVAETLRGRPAGLPRAVDDGFRRRLLGRRTPSQIRLEDALALRRDARRSTVRRGALGVVPDPHQATPPSASRARG